MKDDPNAEAHRLEMLNCVFIRGLQPCLARLLQAHNPKTFEEATRLALIEENHLQNYMRESDLPVVNMVKAKTPCLTAPSHANFEPPYIQAIAEQNKTFSQLADMVSAMQEQMKEMMLQKGSEDDHLLGITH